MKNIILFFLLTSQAYSFAQLSTKKINLIYNLPLTGSAVDISKSKFVTIPYNVDFDSDRFKEDNSALLFSTDSSVININKNNPIITTKSFAISGWAKMNGLGKGVENQNCIFEQRGDDATFTASSAIVLLSEVKDGNAMFIVRSSINQSAQTVYVKTKSKGYNAWNHYVGTLDCTDTLRLFINGEEVGKTKYTQTGNFTSSIDHVNIGTHTHTSNSLRGVFNGLIDDVKIYNTCLSKNEVNELYNEGICRYTEHIIDTVKVVSNIAVTDTLIIKLNIAGLNQNLQNNAIKIYPNPTNDKITISLGFEASLLTGYSLIITNSLSQEVYSTRTLKSIENINLNQLGSKGLYFISIYDQNNKLIDTRKIILE